MILSESLELKTNSKSTGVLSTEANRRGSRINGDWFKKQWLLVDQRPCSFTKCSGLFYPQSPLLEVSEEFWKMFSLKRWKPVPRSSPSKYLACRELMHWCPVPHEYLILCNLRALSPKISLPHPRKGLGINIWLYKKKSIRHRLDTGCLILARSLVTEL